MKNRIDDCLKSQIWDLGNATLYNLCENHFTHRTAEEIVAKTWLIGRSYAVALERVKEKKSLNGKFYSEVIVEKFLNSELDERMFKVKDLELSVENSEAILELHYYLMQLVREITFMDKRSFASKYLHFHLRNLFFIYDSRAVKALREIVPTLPQDLQEYSKTMNYDKDYTKFFFSCLYFRSIIAKQEKLILRPRELDNYLLNS